MPDFLLPDLGEGLTEAEIVTWHVQVGDTVSIDQIVVEVETAKAVVEVPVPFAGPVTARHGTPGDSVAVGAPLITVGADRTQTPALTATPTSGNVLIGYGTSNVERGAGGRRRRRASGPSADAAPLPAPPAPPAVRPRIAVVSPLVRRLARDARIDVATISGSGPDGLITRRDVDRVRLEQRAPAPAAGPDTETETVPVEPTPTVRTPIRGVRKAVADKLSRSRREIPEATVWVDVDATDLMTLRATLNRDPGAAAISVLALVARFAVVGLGRFPELNSRIEADEIVTGPAVHLGFAAQTERGLVVPVVRDAQLHPLQDLGAALAERTAVARAGRLTPAEMAGGTFTVNNYGVFGVDGSAAIINHPEVAILGIGRIIDRPWVVDGQIQVRRLTQLTLTFDHRVCDGATAGGFLRFVGDCIESPAATLRYL